MEIESLAFVNVKGPDLMDSTDTHWFYKKVDPWVNQILVYKKCRYIENKKLKKMFNV